MKQILVVSDMDATAFMRNYAISIPMRTPISTVETVKAQPVNWMVLCLSKVTMICIMIILHKSFLIWMG
jgi:hypothetical protein